MPSLFVLHNREADASKSEQVRMGVCVGDKESSRQAGSLLTTYSEADAFESEQVRMGVCVGDKESSRQAGSLLTTSHEPDGSRTRVRSPFHRSSTSLAYRLTFPPALSGKHPNAFSSFILRPYTQSFVYVVSHLFDTRSKGVSA